MEAIDSSETLVPTHKTTRPCNTAESGDQFVMYKELCSTIKVLFSASLAGIRSPASQMW
jgi:hypothetical protein